MRIPPLVWAIWIGGAFILLWLGNAMPPHGPQNPDFGYLDFAWFAAAIGWGFAPWWLAALIDKAQLWLALHRRHY